MSASSIITTKGTACTTKRGTDSVDTSGCPVRTYAANLTAVTLYLQDRTGEEALRYMAERNRRLVKVYAPLSTDITEADQIIAGSRTLEVIHVNSRGSTGNTGMLGHMRIDCEEKL